MTVTPLMTLARLAFLSWPTLFLASAPATAGSDDVGYRDLSIEFEGDVLDWKFVTSGSARDLAVTVRSPAGERSLQLFGVSAQGIERSPHQTIPIHPDVLALAFADVRSEEGLELVLLTRSGAHSYSPTLPGYRDNVRKLAEHALVYDFPDPHALPFWEYTMASPGERDLVFLPGSESFSLWGADEADAAAYALRTAFTAGDEKVERQKGLVKAEGGRKDDSKSGGDVSFSFSRARGGALFFDDDKDATSLLSDARSYRAPALVDIDGDGRTDLLRAMEDGLHLHINAAGGLKAEPTRIEPVPAFLLSKEGRHYLHDDSEWTLVDLDLDGDIDTIVHWEESVDGFENAKHKLFVLINDGRRLLPEQPQQVLRFEGAELGFQATDVDADGKVDLALSKFELPSLLGTVTGLEFTLTNMLFIGKEGGTFEKKPALRQSETFDETTVDLAVANRYLTMDADGDGIADVVEIDLHGRIAIRRIIKKTRTFGADKWSLERDPWKRFEVRGGLLSLVVDDWNDDGLLDIVSLGDSRLTILFSVRRGQR